MKIRWMICVLIVQLGCLVLTANRSAPVNDEFGHFFAGLGYWQFGDTSTFNVNPPLVRAIGTAPAYLSGMRIDRIENHSTLRPEFMEGRELFCRQPVRFQRMLFLGRCLCVSFVLLTTFLLWHWGSKLESGVSGFLAAAYLAVQPQYLAHGALISGDTVVACMMLVATLQLVRAMDRLSLSQSSLLGCALGLAILCKFTALLLCVIIPFVFVWNADRHPLGKLLLNGVVVALVAMFVIAIPYRFQGWGKPISEYEFVSSTFFSLQGNMLGVIERLPRFLTALLAVPFPEQFILGMDRQQFDFENGLISYAANTRANHGWWWFYLFSMAVKLPLGTLLAIAITVVLLCARLGSLTKGLGVPMIVFAGMILVTALKSGFAQQHRYILPAYPFIFLIIGVVYARAKNIQTSFCRWSSRAILLGLFASFFGCLWAAPNWLASFNLLAGGNTSGFRMLFNDASDWGQDTYLVRDWLEKNPLKKPVYVRSHASDGDVLRSVGGKDFHDFPFGRTLDSEFHLRPYWLVLSKTDAVMFFDISSLIRSESPVEYIGGSHLVYYIRGDPSGE